MEKENDELKKSIEKKRQKKEKQLTKLEILKKLSPGTGLREGLNDIVNSEKGALIVISKGDRKVFKGGFKVDCKFTSKRLAELAKMDGAIILSEDYKKILYVNTLLVPDPILTTIETGTRHQAAERTAKETGGIVIAVSEKKRQITVYYGSSRYVLQNTEKLLGRATETLRVLESQRELLNNSVSNLNMSEITGTVAVDNVCSVLQRLEIIKKMSDIINEYIVELGGQGIIVRMRMKEIVKGIEKLEEDIIKDYSLEEGKTREFFDNLSFQGLLDAENIARLLFGESSDNKVSLKGERILSKTNLSENDLEALIAEFKNLYEIFNSDKKEIKSVLKNRAESFYKELEELRENIMIGKVF